MSDYNLDATFEFIGGFWPYGKLEEEFTGTLSAREGRLRLVSAPVYRRLNQDFPTALFGEFPDAIHGGPPSRVINREPPQVESILGFTKERKCSLLNPVVTEAASSTTSFPSMQKVSATVYERGSAVMGLHLESTEAKSIDSAGFFYTKIHHVLPAGWNTTWYPTEPLKIVLPNAPHQVFRFFSNSLDAEVACKVCVAHSLRIGKGGKIRSVPQLTITPRSPQSVEWFFSIAQRIENFFTLLLGTSVALTKVMLVQGDEIGWLIKRTRRAPEEKINPATWTKTTSHQEVLGALEKWLAVPEENRHVEKILLSMMRKSSVFVETEFLSLAHALEAFARVRLDEKFISPAEFKRGIRQVKDEIGAIWGCSAVAQRCAQLLNHANEPSFGDRLKRLYDLLSPKFALRLLGERDRFARTVTQTRNYFTHPGITKENAVVVEARPLFLLNQRLHAFLRYLMLLDLGVSETALTEPIKYQSTRWR